MLNDVTLSLYSCEIQIQYKQLIVQWLVHSKLVQCFVGAVQVLLWVMEAMDSFY